MLLVSLLVNIPASPPFHPMAPLCAPLSTQLRNPSFFSSSPMSHRTLPQQARNGDRRKDKNSPIHPTPQILLRNHPALRIIRAPHPSHAAEVSAHDTLALAYQENGQLSPNLKSPPPPPNFPPSLRTPPNPLRSGSHTRDHSFPGNATVVGRKIGKSNKTYHHDPAENSPVPVCPGPRTLASTHKHPTSH